MLVKKIKPVGWVKRVWDYTNKQQFFLNKKARNRRRRKLGYKSKRKNNI